MTETDFPTEPAPEPVEAPSEPVNPSPAPEPAAPEAPAPEPVILPGTTEPADPTMATPFT